MTLPLALARLHAAGRIKSPWLAGMLVRNFPWHKPFRVTENHNPTSDEWTPDLTDPATLGCLLALVREASGDEYLHTIFVRGSWWVMDGAWEPESLASARSEGAALSAALIALAEGL